MEPLIRSLTEKLQSENGFKPVAVVRAPGRVNVIGEHIDYHGYSVIPIALSQSVVVAAVPRTDTALLISNVDAKHSRFEGDILNVSIDQNHHYWYNYILCGFKGVMDELSPKIEHGFSMLVASTLPSSCGLSSSSALVCGSALCLCRLLKIDVQPEKLAEICARSERYVSTQGGGMDQAACLLSREGSAQVISFNPLQCAPLQLPADVKFLVANSLVQKDKAVSSEFNERVIEGRLACRILCKKFGVSWQDGMTLKSVQELNGMDLANAGEEASRRLEESYTKEEICQELNISELELEKMMTSNTKHLKKFKLKSRVKHVFEEANNVRMFEAVCRKSQHPSSPNEISKQLGALLRKSHLSCRDAYECSHRDLDEMVELISDVSLGARMTGAGWGGCIVALVRAENVELCKQKLIDGYYNRRNISQDELDKALFVTEAANGAQSFLYS